MFDQQNPQNVDTFNTASVNQQSNSLLGTPAITNFHNPLNPQALNDTTLQANPDVMNMIKALKGDSNG